MPKGPWPTISVVLIPRGFCPGLWEVMKISEIYFLVFSSILIIILINYANTNIPIANNIPCIIIGRK
jgi:hypothetical protein